MKKLVRFYLLPGLASLLILGIHTLAIDAQVPSPARAQSGLVAIVGGTIHVGNGTVLENGVITFSDGKIQKVMEIDAFTEREGYTVIDAAGKEIYPGLISPVSGLGLSEIGSVSATVDQSEIGQLNPNVRSLVAYNTDSEIIPTLRSNGILLAQITPGGGILRGTSSIVQLDAWNWEDAAYREDDAIHLNWPGMQQSRGYGGGSTIQKNPQYDEQIASLEKIFADALGYSKDPDPEKVNLRLEAMKGLFNGEKSLFISAGYVKEVIESIHFAKKHQVQKIVLVGADEDAWLARELLIEHEIPVLIANIHRHPDRKDDDVRLPYKLPAMFMDEGLLVGLYLSSATRSMNLPFIAGHTVGYGLSREEALQYITLNNAKILGIDDRTGSLEPGKDANILISEGDLLDMITSRVTHAWIQGRNVSLDNKHKQLYHKFGEKYSE